MKKSRYSEEQIIGFLKQADAGMPIKELCRKGGFSDATFYKWRSKFGGMDVSDAKRLKELDIWAVTRPAADAPFSLDVFSLHISKRKPDAFEPA